jgi:hypothetical protein
MGFIITTYQLYGLPPLPNIYVSIHGTYSVKKNFPTAGVYTITFTTYYQASQNNPVITQTDMSFNIQALPTPADLYTQIYGYIKGQLDPNYGTANQTLQFTDD